MILLEGCRGLLGLAKLMSQNLVG